MDILSLTTAGLDAHGLIPDPQRTVTTLRNDHGFATAQPADDGGNDPAGSLDQFWTDHQAAIIAVGAALATLALLKALQR